MDVPRVRRPAKRRPTWLIGLGLAALIGGVGTFFIARRPTTAPQVAIAPGQSVTVAPVEVGSISRTIDATGTVAAIDLLPVLSQATGLQVQQILVSEGQTVTRGQVLAQLDPSVLQAQLNQARAQQASSQAVIDQRQASLQQQQATLAQAQSDLNRYRQLANAGAISGQELETRSTAVATAQAAVGTAQAAITSAQADVQAAAAQVQRLQTQLAQTEVRAPDNGVIAESLTKVGDVTSSSGKLFTIIRNGALELQAKVPETQLPQIRVGSPVKITSDSDKRLQLQSTVREIAPLVDPQTRQATVKITLPQNPALRSGIFLRASIVTQQSQAPTIPTKALLPQANGSSRVFVLQPDNTVQARTIETGLTQGGTDPNAGRVEVIRGLNPGEKVVISGAGYLKDGDRVNVVGG